MIKLIDMRGVACPGPVIAVKKEAEDMIAGELEVLVDNQAAVQNLSKYGEYKGFEVTWEKKEEKEFSVHILVGPKALRSSGEFLTLHDEQDEKRRELEKEKEEKERGTCETCSLVDPESVMAVESPVDTGAVMVISSDLMGTGDEDLGRILMKGFLYAMTEQEKVPEEIILYNRGVMLAVEGAESLEDLKTIRNSGSRIYACGTCLNHYGLMDRLAVGEVTNMYEITEKLMKARKVIRP